MSASRSALAPAAGASSAAGGVARARTLWLALGAIALAAFAYQLRLGVYTDPLWLMICCERWLDGQTAYVDFLENSPPAAILVYLPPVVVARWLGVAREPLFVAYVLVVVGLCVGLCARLLSSAWKAGRIGAPTLLGAAAVLLLAPDYAFGQRVTRSRVSASGGSPGTSATMAISCGGGPKTDCRPRAMPVPMPPMADSLRQRSKPWVGPSSGSGSSACSSVWSADAVVSSSPSGPMGQSSQGSGGGGVRT